MLLSDTTIRSLLASRDVRIIPHPDDTQFQPISIDLRLDNSWSRESGEHGWSQTLSDHVTLRAGEFILGATRERVILPAHIAAFVHGKSTWARRGLVVEAAGLVDPGFNGTITLEMKNVSGRPLVLTAGQPICQITFQAVDMAVLRPYGSYGLNSHYQGQDRAEPAR